MNASFEECLKFVPQGETNRRRPNEKVIAMSKP
jgi:hypothetical protein